MITAQEARQLAENKYNFIFDEIERIAKHGGHEYDYKDSKPMHHDLYVYLVELGYKVLFKEEVKCDEDHYGKEIEGTERTVYHNIINWW